MISSTDTGCLYVAMSVVLWFCLSRPPYKCFYCTLDSIHGGMETYDQIDDDDDDDDDDDNNRCNHEYNNDNNDKNK